MKKNLLALGLIIFSLSLYAQPTNPTYINYLDNNPIYPNNGILACHDGTIDITLQALNSSSVDLWTAANGYIFTWYNDSGVVVGTGKTWYNATVPSTPLDDACTIHCILTNTSDTSWSFDCGPEYVYNPPQLVLNFNKSSFYGGYNVASAGGHSGFLLTEIAGGIPGYTFQWSGSNSSNYNSLYAIGAGIYTVVITDDFGCTISKTDTLREPSPIVVTSISSPAHGGYNVSCRGGKDGAVNLAVTGGVPPYHFEWDNGKFSKDINSLEAGRYEVKVKDTLNVAEVHDTIWLTQPTNSLASTLTAYRFPSGFNLSCNNCGNGSVSLTTNGGVSPYTYLWSTGATTSSLSSLIAGEYSVTIKDTNNCQVIKETVLLAPGEDGWQLAGNPGTDSTTQFIGTTDSKPLIFKTNNTERIHIEKGGRIYMNGNVSINNLHLNKPLILDTLKINRIMAQDGDSIVRLGTGSFNWNQNTNTMFASPVGVYGGFALGFNSKAYGTNSISIGFNSQAMNTGPRALTLGNYLMATGDNSMLIGSGGPAGPILVNAVPYSLGIGFNSDIPTLFVTKSPDPAAPNYTSNTGNVGIGGINDPQDNLEIVGVTRFTANLTTRNKYLKIRHNGTNALIDNSVTTDDIILQSNLYVNQDQVGIGVAPSPALTDYKLFVLGGVMAQKVMVALKGGSVWPDYVFATDYKLRNLSDLEKFIIKNKHLPDMPAASEVGEGVDLLKMQIEELKKIEELTLYVIQLKKENEELRKLIESK